MEDDRGVGDERADEILVDDRARHELDAGRDRVGPAREEVVEDGDLGVGLGEPADERAADEAGAARDEDAAAGEGRAIWSLIAARSSVASRHRCVRHRLTPVRSRIAGRKRRHQSRMPRIFV